MNQASKVMRDYNASTGKYRKTKQIACKYKCMQSLEKLRRMTYSEKNYIEHDQRRQIYTNSMFYTENF